MPKTTICFQNNVNISNAQEMKKALEKGEFYWRGRDNPLFFTFNSSNIVKTCEIIYGLDEKNKLTIYSATYKPMSTSYKNENISLIDEINVDKNFLSDELKKLKDNTINATDDEKQQIFQLQCKILKSEIDKNKSLTDEERKFLTTLTDKLDKITANGTLDNKAKNSECIKVIGEASKDAQKLPCTTGFFGLLNKVINAVVKVYEFKGNQHIENALSESDKLIFKH